MSVAREGEHGQVSTSLRGCKGKTREGARMGGCKSENEKAGGYKGWGCKHKRIQGLEGVMVRE